VSHIDDAILADISISHIFCFASSRWHGEPIPASSVSGITVNGDAGSDYLNVQDSTGDDRL